MGLQRWIERSVTTILLVSTVACLLVVLYGYHETGSAWDDDVTMAVYSLDGKFCFCLFLQNWVLYRRVRLLLFVLALGIVSKFRL